MRCRPSSVLPDASSHKILLGLVFIANLQSSRAPLHLDLRRPGDRSRYTPHAEGTAARLSLQGMPCRVLRHAFNGTTLRLPCMCNYTGKYGFEMRLRGPRSCDPAGTGLSSWCWAANLAAAAIAACCWSGGRCPRF